MSDHDNSDEGFDLKLSGRGINIERRIDRETAAAVMAAILSDQPANDGLAPIQNKEPPNESVVQLSLREFLDEVKATRKPDQIVAIGHYICHHEDQPDFSRDDVRMRFSMAKEPMPANFPRDFATAGKAGMLAEVHQKSGRFYVTNKGIKAVEEHFSKVKQK